MTFLRPVRGIDPAGIIRHPALTVTVDDPAALVEVLRWRASMEPNRRTSGVVQEAEDELHTMTTRQLRDLADASRRPPTRAP